MHIDRLQSVVAKQPELLSFQGRLCRLEYFKVALPNMIVIAMGLLIAIPMAKLDGLAHWLGVGIALVSLTLVIWITAAAVVKRLHDRGRSGTWLVLYGGIYALVFFGQLLSQSGLSSSGQNPAVSALVFLASLAMLIDLQCMRGTRGANQYGVDPLEQ